jgi:hypothetical protein
MSHTSTSETRFILATGSTPLTATCVIPRYTPSSWAPLVVAESEKKRGSATVQNAARGYDAFVKAYFSDFSLKDFWLLTVAAVLFVALIA